MATYVVDLRYYLDEAGEIVTDMPWEARQLASFIPLIVDEASGTAAANTIENLADRSDSLSATNVVAFA